MVRRILVVGHSHVDALDRAKTGDRSFDNVEISWLMSKNGIGKVPDEEAKERIRSLDRGDLLALSILGTSHNIHGLLKHPIPFDFFEPKGDGLRSGGQAIPYAALRDHFESLLAGNGFIPAAAASAACPVVHLAVPPVKADEGWIYANASKYRGNVVRDVGLTPAPVRAKLWRLEMESIQKVVSRWGVGFVPAPQESIDENGFLRRAHYGADVTHANRDYGRLVLRDLVALAEMRTAA
jgi:hypothetical protein